MTPIIIDILLLVLVGITFIGLGRKIVLLQRALTIETEGREIDRQLCSKLFRRLDNFLDQWVPAVEHGITSAIPLTTWPHAHWFADRSSGPNWFVKECRCGKTVEGPLSY